MDKMRNIVSSIVNAIGAILVGSCKIAYLLAIVAFFLTQLIWLYPISHASDALNLAVPGIVNFFDYGFAVASAITALYGCYAVFKSDKTHLRNFSCLCGIIALLLIARITLKTASNATANTDFERQLNSSLKSYDWLQDSSTSVSQETRKWDMIQSNIFCCGIRSTSDWDQYRPANVEADRYPLSCCVKNFTPDDPPAKKLCKKGGTFVTGCLESIEANEDLINKVNTYFAIGLVIIGALSFIMSLAVGERSTTPITGISIH